VPAITRRSFTSRHLLGRDRATAGVTHGVSEADASLIPSRGALLLHVTSG
jgi:hypothetical protein